MSSGEALIVCSVQRGGTGIVWCPAGRYHTHVVCCCCSAAFLFGCCFALSMVMLSRWLLMSLTFYYWLSAIAIEHIMSFTK